MDDSESQRQSRHALLEGFDHEGVEAVAQSRVLVIGAGGLGCPAVTYLITAGLGTLHWVDYDTVDRTNLARQTLFGPADIGHPKVLAGKQALLRLSPQSQIIADARKADAAFLDIAVPMAEVVLDCTDQWAIRQEINAACVKHRVPLVSAAAIQWSGQLLVFNPHHDHQACYACVFDPRATPEDAACGAYGVLGPMVGAMGCLQAAEALKVIVGKSDASRRPVPQLLSLLDMKTGRWQQLVINRNPDCPVCARPH